MAHNLQPSGFTLSNIFLYSSMFSLKFYTKSLNPLISDNLLTSPHIFFVNQSAFSGIYGRSSSNAIPPVNRNLKYSSFKSPLKVNSLVANKKENNSLSFSNRDLQILQYKE